MTKAFIKGTFLLIVPLLLFTSCMTFKHPLVPLSQAFIDEELTGLWSSVDKPDEVEFQISDGGNNQYLFNELNEKSRDGQIKDNQQAPLSASEHKNIGTNNDEFNIFYSFEFDGNKYLMLTNKKADNFFPVKYEIRDGNIYFFTLNESFFENALNKNKLKGNISTEKILGANSKNIEITSKTKELQKFFSENKDSLFNEEGKTEYKKFADYIQKFSVLDAWHSNNPDITCKFISEIKIYSISKDKKTIKAEIFHAITPFSPIIREKVDFKLKGDKYVFTFTDPWKNKAFGWFKYTDDGADFFLNCRKFSRQGKNCARLYGDIPSTLYETTHDKDFFKREIDGEGIIKILNNFDKTKFSTEGKRSFYVHYIGTIDNIEIYKTELIWGSAQRCTHRLVFVKNSKPVGEYYGIASNKIKIKNKTIIFADIDDSIGNVIDMTNSIPQKIYIDGELIDFENY